jgi:glycosyltransferase involved in cell wall biosynthesis
MTGRDRLNLPVVVVVALQTGKAANGGIASIGEIVRGLHGYRPVVITNRESPVVARWRDAGVDIRIVPEDASRGIANAPLATLRTYWRYFRAVRAVLKDTGARIVHANDPLAFQLCLPAARTIPGVRLALNIRDTIGPDRPPPAARYRRVFGMTDHIFFLSADMLARWSAIVPGIEAKSSVTYSIVDPARFSPAPPPREAPPVVLVSGVVCAKKGQREFLQVVAPVLAGAGIESWLVGDIEPDVDDYAAECRTLAAPMGDAVRFLGHRRDIAALYARATVVCVASRYEGLMRTMIEAMACARPVVSTDVASAREMLLQPGMEAGAVFPVGCSREMAAEIAALCADPARAAVLGANGVAIASRTFRADDVVAAYEQAYGAMTGRQETRA